MFTPLPPQRVYSFVKTITMLEQYFGDEVTSWPKPLQRIKFEEQDLAMIAVGMTVAFLTEALIDEQMIKTGTYHLYSPESKESINELNYMVLDSQALEHLEIVESAKGAVEGSLFEYIDHCKT